MLNKLRTIKLPKIPLAVKLLAVFSLVMLFWSIGKEKEMSNPEEVFVEMPAVELVYAEVEAIPDSSGKVDKDVIKEKEKMLEEMVANLKAREEALVLKEKALEVKSDNLKSIMKEIDLRVERLNLLQAVIGKELQRQKQVNEANITKLAKVYESTSPPEAGALLSKIDVDIAARILLKMNNMKAGKMWGFVEKDRAVEISKKLATYNMTAPLPK